MGNDDDDDDDDNNNNNNNNNNNGMKNCAGRGRAPTDPGVFYCMNISRVLASVVQQVRWHIYLKTDALAGVS